MKRLIVVLALIASACTDPGSATKALLDAGYSSVEITGYRPFKCAEKTDQYATGFKAVGPSGRPVSGTVCAGLLKGKTIRLD